MSIANLAQDGRLIVKQRVEGFEAITGVETRNRYEVLTPEGQSVMLAHEESGGLGRVFSKRNRALTLHIAGLDGQDILVARRGADGTRRPLGTIRRKFGLLKRRLARGRTGRDSLLAVPTDGRSGPTPTPQGTRRPLGTIRRKFGLLKRRLVIEDARGETVAEVSGSVFRRYTFMVNRRGEEIGRITKQWSGVGREMEP